MKDAATIIVRIMQHCKWVDYARETAEEVEKFRSRLAERNALESFIAITDYGHGDVLWVHQHARKASAK